MKTYWHTLTFLILELDGGEWLASCPGHFITGEDLGTHWIESLEEPRASLDMVAKKKFTFSTPAENQDSDFLHPACM